MHNKLNKKPKPPPAPPEKKPMEVKIVMDDCEDERIHDSSYYYLCSKCQLSFFIDDLLFVDMKHICRKCAPKIKPKRPSFEFDADGNASWFRICQVKGELYEVTCSYEQYIDWQNGQLIQHAMSNLSDEQREFIIGNLTPAEHSMVFGDE